MGEAVQGGLEEDGDVPALAVPGSSRPWEGPQSLPCLGGGGEGGTHPDGEPVPLKTPRHFSLILLGTGPAVTANPFHS